MHERKGPRGVGGPFSVRNNPLQPHRRVELGNDFLSRLSVMTLLRKGLRTKCVDGRFKGAE
jgi:hypothetical protein